MDSAPPAIECPQEPATGYGQSSEVRFDGHAGFLHDFWYCNPGGLTKYYESEKYYNRVNAISYECPTSHPYGPEYDHYFGPDKDRGWQRICYNPQDFCYAPYEWNESLSDCVTYCPADSPDFDPVLGVCVAKPQNTPNKCDVYAGNPINILTGEKVQQFAPDFSVGNAGFPIALSRSYYSFVNPYLHRRSNLANTTTQSVWIMHRQPLNYKGPSVAAAQYDISPSSAGQVYMSHNYNTRIIKKDDTNVLYRYASGKNESVATDVPRQFSGGRMKQLADGWEVFTNKGIKEHFDANGYLTALTHPSGSTQQLIYDEQQRLASIKDSHGYEITFNYNEQSFITDALLPDGQRVHYQYDNFQRLSAVVFPDGSNENYLYEDPNYPYLLTAIVDTNGEKYAQWEFDAQGRAISSQHAGGTDRTEIEYADGVSHVSNEHGHVKSVYFSATDGRITKIVGESCSTDGVNSEITFSGSNPVSIMEKDGATTRIGYQGKKVRYTQAAFGLPEAATTYYTWHPEYDVLTEASFPNSSKVSFQYGSNGRLEQKKHSWGSTHRIWNYSYNDDGLLESVDGPRSDVEDITRFYYDDQRQLATVENALGHRTEILAYDASGRVTQIKDENGVITQFSYDARGRVLSQSTSNLETNFTYSSLGLLQTIHSPDTVLHYEYDAARRLTTVADANGNRLEYEYDLAGNITQSTIKDAESNVKNQQQTVYDKLNRVHQRISASDAVWQNQYDTLGNLIKLIDPAENTSSVIFDVLKRPTQQKDQLEKPQNFQYNSMGQVTAVSDALGRTTTYKYNGFGDVIEQKSPDSGLTKFEYDLAGNMTKRIDARGIVTQFSYDALNRMLSQTYVDTTQNVSFSYDNPTSGQFGIGKLYQVHEPSGSTTYHYNTFGDITQESRSIQGQTYVTEYVYNANGQLTSVQYPYGDSISYTYDANGMLTSVHKGAGTELLAVVTDINYLPFGPIAQLKFGNDQLQQRDYDLDYKLVGLQTSALAELTYQYDVMSNITAIDNALSTKQSYEYDAVSRLIASNTQGTEQSFDYDAIGNRLSITENTETIAYVYSNGRLTQAGNELQLYDAAGNVIQKGNTQFSYNNAGRLTQAITATTTSNYQYNF